MNYNLKESTNANSILRKSIKEKMDSKSEEIYYLLYRLFELNLIQTSDYEEDRFDEITDYIEENGVDKSYKNEAYKLAMQYINHNFSNSKEYKEIIKKFLDLFGLQVNTHSVEWNIISESKKSLKESRKIGYIRKTEYEINGNNYPISDNGKLFKIIDNLNSKGFTFKYESEWISKDICKHFLADDDKAKVDLYK